MGYIKNSLPVYAGEKISTEVQKTFWFEYVRFCQFIKSKKLVKLADGKIIGRVYVGGEPAQGIKYSITK